MIHFEKIGPDPPLAARNADGGENGTDEENVRMAHLVLDVKSVKSIIVNSFSSNP